MKNVTFARLSFILVVIGLCGCSTNTPFSNLELKDGVYYQKGQDKAFTGKVISKYNNDKDSLIGTLTNGKFDGEVMTYYDNGNKKEVCQYKMGACTESKAFSEDGSPVCDCNEVTFDDSKRLWIRAGGNAPFTGTCISFWDNRNKRILKRFKVGNLRENAEFFENGNVKISYIYNEEETNVSRLIGYENGQKDRYITYDEKNILTDEHWYKNGNKSYCHIYSKSLDGWYENGQVAYHIESNPNTPMLSTITLAYNDLKNILQDLRFVKNGKGKSYYPNGEWMSEFFLKNEKEIRFIKTSENGEQSDHTAFVSVVTKNGNSINHDKKFSDSESYPYIDEIAFYTPNDEYVTDLYIFGEVTTIEDACKWYSTYWSRGNPDQEYDPNHINYNITVVK